MSSVLRRRSVRAVTRGGARSWLMVVTLAVAIVGVWLLAIPSVIDSTMNHRVGSDALSDIRFFPNALPLDDAELASIAAIPHIVAADAKVVSNGQVGFEGRTLDVSLVGVAAFDSTSVNRVRIEAGSAPGPGEVVVDSQNLQHDRLKADIGDSVVVYGPGGDLLRMTVTGSGGSLLWAGDVREGDPVVYMGVTDLLDLTGWPGFTSLELLVDTRDETEIDAIVAAVEVRIDTINPGMTYWRAPTVRTAGDWPGKDGFDNFRSLFTILATVAVVSGLFVVYNTINTMVRREAREIGVMKAVGGRRSHIARAYLETAALMGAIATVIGSLLGILLTNLLVQSIGSSLMATQADFGVPLPVIAIALLVGIGGAVVSALPAVMWATRIPVREALESRGIEASAGRARLGRALQRIGFLSRPSQIGVRSAARNTRRSMATGLQIGVAVAVAFAFISLGATMLALVDQSFDAEIGDIHVYDQGGARSLDAAAAAALRGVDGVASIEPIHYAALDFGGTTYGAWALPATTAYPYDLIAGRWFAEGETGVAVVGQSLATERDLEVGDTVTVDRFDRIVDIEIVGIDAVMVDDGKSFFVPLDPWLAAAGRTAPNAFWVETTSPDPDTVDAAAGAIEQTLRSAGYTVRTQLRYVERAATRSEATLILSFIVLLGVPVLAIGMIALVNTLTINALERTKEIGILRSIGASRKHLARMFRAEGMVIAVLGWLLGIPLGYASARLLVWVIARSFEATFPVVFPLWSLLPVLVLTMAVAALSIRRPLRRAVRMSAGDALRYE